MVRKKGGACAPPLSPAFIPSPSELVIPAGKERATIQVVLSRKRRDVSVAGGRTGRDSVGLGIQHVLVANQHAPVRLLITGRHGEKVQVSLIRGRPLGSRHGKS